MLDVALIGGGHSHALLLRAWSLRPLAGVRLTLVTPEPATPYSGRLPGYVAGHYRRREIEIDVAALARRAGARLVLDRVVDLEAGCNRAHTSRGGAISYDAASIDIGVTSDAHGPARPGRCTVPAKPSGALIDAWDRFVAGLATGRLEPRAAVIGGGLGGIELALAMAHRLRHVPGAGPGASVTLVERGDRILPQGPEALRALLTAELSRAGVVTLTGAAASGAAGLASQGEPGSAAFVTAVAGATPAAWLAHSGLALHEGFIRVDETLRSRNHPYVFATGDIAHLDAAPRPKAGVYAVRQAKVLYANLARSLAGRPLCAYRPQGDHLKLVSLGGRNAVAEKWGRVLQSPRVWAWKDRIDHRFLARLASVDRADSVVP